MLTLLGVLFFGFSGGLVASYYACLRMLRPRWQRKANREWYPPSGFGDKLFGDAEEYRKLEERRQMHDAGRSHPPRADSGPPAKINRMVIRSRRSTR